MGARKRNGEGTISGPRADGRYVGAFYAPTSVKFGYPGDI